MYIILILEVMVKDNLLRLPMKINNSKCFQCHVLPETVLDKKGNVPCIV